MNCCRQNLHLCLRWNITIGVVTLYINIRLLRNQQQVIQVMSLSKTCTLYQMLTITRCEAYYEHIQLDKNPKHLIVSSNVILRQYR